MIGNRHGCPHSSSTLSLSLVVNNFMVSKKRLNVNYSRFVVFKWICLHSITVYSIITTLRSEHSHIDKYSKCLSTQVIDINIYFFIFFLVVFLLGSEPFAQYLLSCNIIYWTKTKIQNINIKLTIRSPWLSWSPVSPLLP